MGGVQVSRLRSISGRVRGRGHALGSMAVDGPVIGRQNAAQRLAGQSPHPHVEPSGRDSHKQLHYKIATTVTRKLISSAPGPSWTDSAEHRAGTVYSKNHDSDRKNYRQAVGTALR